jgi:hypothetical protein
MSQKNTSYFVSLIAFSIVVFTIGRPSVLGISYRYTLFIMLFLAAASIIMSFTKMSQYKYALWQFSTFCLLSIAITYGEHLN